MASECVKTSSTKGLDVAEDGTAKHVPNNTKEDNAGDASGSAMEAKVKEPDAKGVPGDATAKSGAAGSAGDPETHHGEVEGGTSNPADPQKDAQGDAGDATVNDGEKKPDGDSKDQSGKQHKKVDDGHSSSSSSSSSSDSEGEAKPGCTEKKKKVKKGKADQVKGGSERDSNKTKLENCKC